MQHQAQFAVFPLVMLLFVGVMILFAGLRHRKGVLGFLASLMLALLVFAGLGFLFTGFWSYSRLQSPAPLRIPQVGESIGFSSQVSFGESEDVATVSEKPAAIQTPEAAAAPDGSREPTSAIATGSAEIQVTTSADWDAQAADVAGAVTISPPSAPERTPSGEPMSPRPAWMDEPDGLTGSVYRTKVHVGGFATREECDRELPEALREASTTFIVRLLGPEHAGLVRLPLPYIHQQIVRGEWEEHRQHSIGSMVYLHTLLEFDEQAVANIQRMDADAQKLRRLGYTGGGAGLVMGLLATLFGYLKLDTLTKGYYTGRLRLASGAVILAVGAAAALLVLRS